MLIIILLFIGQQLCSRCGNINTNLNTNLNSNLPPKNFSASNLPFVFPFENNYPPYSNSLYSNNSFMSNSNAEQSQNQNLFSKNIKKQKKTKKNDKKYKDKRPFDWICNRCDNLNYSFRTFCNICNLPKNQNIFYKSSNK